MILCPNSILDPPPRQKTPPLSTTFVGTIFIAPENIEHWTRNMQWNWVLARTNNLEPINVSAWDVGFTKILDAHGA
jgi:hypothetical protein